MFDTSHPPMLRPLWVRLLICAVCLGWAFMELNLGNDTWALIFGGLGVFCIHQLLLTYSPPTEDNSDNEPEE